MRKNLDTLGLSARHQRVLALGIHGADDDTPIALDALIARAAPDAVQALTGEDLVTLRADLEARLAEMPPDTRLWTDEHLADAEKIATAIEALTADETRRETETAERAEKADALLARLRPADEGEPVAERNPDGGTEPPDEAEPDPDAPVVPEPAPTPEPDETPEVPEPAEADEPEKIAAAAPIARRVEARGNPTKPVARPSKPDERLVLRASANAGGFGAGELLDTPDKIARAFLGPIRASAGYTGPRVDLPIMSLGAWDAADIYGEDRTLDDNARANAKKIEAVTGRQALRASGGICAPPPVLYDQPVLGTDARPVRDSMVARFGADRGGIRTLPPPHLTDVGGAITTWTEANDVTPSDPATKACLTLTCPAEEETLVDAIVSCLKIGNYRARNFPEQITAWMSKIAQLAARTAETKMLTEIGAGSTQITVAATGNELGTARNILATLDRAGAQIRSRHRLDPDYPLRFGAPFWLKDNMITDVTREQPGATAERLATSEAEINAWLRAKRINVTWFLDGETGQVYGAQADGALNGWASHVIAYLYPEGQWLGLDAGSLDFGITRDSTLNATNDFTIMSEFFEKTHQIDLADSYRLDIDICPNGQTSLPVEIDPCTAGS